MGEIVCTSVDENTMRKVHILADAAKYDVACTSSGVDRDGREGMLGNARACGICHSFAADGRCISLLKILYTNHCVYDCKYCINRASNDVPRAMFDPDELCRLTVEFYKRNYIEGLFLSSGVYRNPAYTMQQICDTLLMLRTKYCFNGYIHVKTIPGAPDDLLAAAGYLADRVSVNLELPTVESLKKLAPNKTFATILNPMSKIQSTISAHRTAIGKDAKMERASGNRLLSNSIFNERGLNGTPAVEGTGNVSLPGTAPQSCSGHMSRGEETSYMLLSEEGEARTVARLSSSGRGASVYEKALRAGGASAAPEKALRAGGASAAPEKAQRAGIASPVYENAYSPRGDDFTGKLLKQDMSSYIKDVANDPMGYGKPIPAPSLGLVLPGKNAVLSQADKLRRPFAPAGQSTQMIIGATDETDYNLIMTTQTLYQTYDLKRVFYSAYIPINEDSALPGPGTPPPLLREHRLYQADFLLRYYGFRAHELLSEEKPNFRNEVDPKCDWALNHLGMFPVEVEKAPYEELLRVPGIGPKSAMRIVNARRHGHLSYDALKKIGVVLKRAHYFITCGGKMMYRIPLEERYIFGQLAVGEQKENWKIAHENEQYTQMNIFDYFGVEKRNIRSAAGSIFT